MGVAVTTTPTAPTLKTAYRWTKVVGTDGIPGEVGADGQTSYLHIKYSDDGVNFTANNGEDVGAWIGTYVDFIQADSTNFSDYTWNKVRGEDGYTPVKGTDYFDGVDGTSAYLWVRYSQNSDGDPMTTNPTGAKYIGIATTTTASAPTDYTDYSWSLIKGTDGIPGEPGADGRTSYLHIKYSDDGETFTANGGETVGAWIGTYVDFVQEDSTNFEDYTWNKVRGEDGRTPVKGTDYFDGVDGQDGISSYLWIKYSADADGTDFSDTPNTYMGVAVTTTPTAPTLKTAYRWTKVVGTDGIPGEVGADGQTSYLHIKYSDDGETFTPIPGWQMEIEQTIVYYQAILYAGRWLAQGFKPIGGLIGAGKIRAQVRSYSKGGTPPDTHWYVYNDNNGVPGISITKTYGIVTGEQWPASTAEWATAEIELEEYLQDGQQYWLVLAAQGTYNSTDQVKYRCTKGDVDVYPDGQRAYSSDGTSWSKQANDIAFKIEAPLVNEGETPGAYIGTYVDFNPVDSTNFSDYTWNKVRGEDGYTPIKGVDYFDGVDGQDGTSAYLWVRYSQNFNPAQTLDYTWQPNDFDGVLIPPEQCISV
jgi:hypothetical protein